MTLSRLFPLFDSLSTKLPFYLSIRSESTHVFREVIPWEHNMSLANHLAKNVVFNDGKLVVINKPYGVCSSRKGTTKQYLNAPPVGDNVFNIYDALPHLAKKLGYSELFLASIPERYTSGVTVLTTSSNLKTRVKQCLQLSKVSNDTMNQYYAVVVGSPNSLCGSFNLAIKMSSNVCNQPILVPVTKKGLRNQKMHSVRAVYSTLSSSNLASLLAIRSSTATLNALRIICTDKFISPILGDNMFGSRVKNVLGKDVLVGFNNESIKKPQKLRSEILDALKLSPGEELIVPTHLHLYEVYLAKFFNSDIVLRAPLPPLFQWSCNKLGLEVPECGPCEKFLRKEVLKNKRENQEQQEKQEGDCTEIGVVIEHN